MWIRLKISLQESFYLQSFEAHGVTWSGDLLNFWQLFKAFGNN